ncbi:unnamed protein product, partial [Ceratitis capitata]
DTKLGVGLLLQMSQQSEKGDNNLSVGERFKDMEAGSSKAPNSEPYRSMTCIEQLSRLIAQMMQQNDMMSQCMNKVRQMQKNGRVTEMETSAHSQKSRAERKTQTRSR